ncbi:MAG: hypothetical protein ACRDIA_05835 [Actinomycetota bacterium]
MADDTSAQKIGDARDENFGAGNTQAPKGSGGEQSFGDAVEEAIETDDSLKMEKKIKEKLED